MNGQARLSDAERETLRAVCDAFHPRLSAESGDDPELFATAASDVGVPEAAEEAIALLPETERGELRQLLRLLGGRLLPVLLRRMPRRFASMGRGEQERMLIGMSESVVPQLRSGFQALKRLSSFLYYASESGRVWPHIGYGPPTDAVAPADPLTLAQIDRDTTIDCDACVVGSGAGGGVVAAALAARGLKVVVLEAGPRDQSPDFPLHELAGMQRLYHGSALTSTRDAGVSILAGACVGGGTAVNWQTSLRTPDFIRDEWARSSGCDLFTSTAFDHALDAVSSRLSISSAESVVNANNAVIRRGCDALGWAHSPIERNSRGCESRACGGCVFGCRRGGKQSTTVTYLRDAQSHGATIVASCRAERVRIENGRAVGVDAVVHESTTHFALRVRAPRVIVCAGGLESPALLQRSGIELSQLGRNLFLHPTTAVAGVYADRIAAWEGPPQTMLCGEFARARGNYGFRLETAPAHPGLLALAAPWTGARAHRRLMQDASRVSAVIVLTRDAVGGRVSARRDGSIAITYRPDSMERGLLAEGVVAASRVHRAAGAERVMSLHAKGFVFDARSDSREFEAWCKQVGAARVADNRATLFSAHQMGTCRMGKSPQGAVCDERGAVFGVRGLHVADASVFPASSGVNPMLTIMALATCIAASID